MALISHGGAGQSVTYRKCKHLHLIAAFTRFGGVLGENKINQATTVIS